MSPGFRFNGTSLHRNSVRLLGAASVVALGAWLTGLGLVGCSHSGGDAEPGKGGSSASEGGDGSGNGAKGGSQASGDAGAMTAEGGLPSSGGTATAGSSAGGSDASGGEANSEGGAPSNPGGVGLGASDGITGTIDGVVHAHTFNALRVPQQSETAVIGANSQMYPLWDAWGMRLLPKLGEQACTGDTGTEDIFITFGSQSNFSATGTTAGGSCTINVTSLAPKFEGTFTASLKTDHGLVAVTDGAFRVPN